MLIIPPPKFRSRRKQVKQHAMPGALMLVSVDYDWGDEVVVLSFNQAIDISGLDATLITLDDPVHNHQFYLCDGGTDLLSDTSVQLALNSIGANRGSTLVMNAPAGNGIAAVSGGASWVGVTDLSLPFP
jgi:hypothetical protein